MNEWTAIRTLTEPEAEPVSASDVRSQLRLSDTSSDADLVGFATSAREFIEKYTKRTFITTTYELYFDKFPEVIELLKPPVQSVTSIKYNDSDGEEQTLSTELYRTDLVSVLPRIVPAYGEVWPTTRQEVNAVKVTYVAGYGDAATDVPWGIRLVIRQMAAAAFEMGESQTEIKLYPNEEHQRVLASFKIPVVA